MKKIILLFALFLLFGLNAKGSLDSLFKKADEKSITDFKACQLLCIQGKHLAGLEKNEIYSAAFQTLIGKAYYFKGQYDSAVYYFNSAISLLEKHEANDKLAFTYNELAKLYRRTKKYDKALASYDKAFKIYQQLKDSAGIGMIYNESGVVFELQSNLEEALKRYKLSYQMARMRNDRTGQAYALNFMGNIYTLSLKTDEAASCFEKAIQLHSIVKDTFALGWCYLDQAKYFKSAHHIFKAYSTLEKANTIARQLQLPDLLAKSYLLHADLDALTGDYKSAYSSFLQHTTMKDSLFNETNNRLIEELNAKYQSSEKEKTIFQQKARIHTKNTFLFSLISAIILLLLLGWLYFNRKKIMHEKRMQAEILRQQDIATRAVIVAEEKERVRIAADLHDGIGQLLSAAKMNLHAIDESIDQEERQRILNNAIALVEESAKEVRSVSHYIMPNALLKSGLGFAVKDFIEKLDHHKLAVHVNTIGLQEKLDTNIEIVVYRIIQECVNNVIKHSQANRLDISLINENGFLDITIEDNGKGFDLQKEINAGGIGLKNIVTRITYLKATLDIDTHLGNGTLMAFHIPLST